MQECYPSFAGLLHNTMYRDVVLRVAKLLDPATAIIKKINHDNATLSFLELYGDPIKIDSFKNAVAKIQPKKEAILILRNKVLAHSDVNTALGKNKIKSPDREQVSAILREIGSAVREFHLAYHPSDFLVMPIPGVTSINIIHNALWAKLGQVNLLAAIDLGQSSIDSLRPKFIYPNRETEDWWDVK